MLHSKFLKTEEELSLEKAGGTVEERIKDLLELDSVKSKGFNPINFKAAVDHAVEKNSEKTAKGLMGLFTKDMTDILDTILENGPVKDSEISSKEARNEMVDLGLVCIVADKGGKGKLTAATMDAVSLRKAAGVKEEEKDEDDEDDDKKSDKKDKD